MSGALHTRLSRPDPQSGIQKVMPLYVLPGHPSICRSQAGMLLLLSRFEVDGVVMDLDWIYILWRF